MSLSEAIERARTCDGSEGIRHTHDPGRHHCAEQRRPLAMLVRRQAVM
jgi:hypothetical protein